MKCFWIFHDWIKTTVFGNDNSHFYATGFECRQCGARKLKEDKWIDTEDVQNALNWMKEEVIP